MSHTTGSSIRILCVDDHPLVLAGVVAILETEPDMAVVGESSCGEDAVALFEELRPDVTLMDLRLPGMSGIEAIQSIRKLKKDARIIALTTYKGDVDIHRALQAGAYTYLLKDMLRRELIDAIRETHFGRRLIPSEVALRLAEHVPRVEITPRENEILRLMAAGLRNKEIAGQLGISEETVKFHVKSILSKLHVSDRTHAVTTALKRGIIHLD